MGQTSERDKDLKELTMGERERQKLSKKVPRNAEKWIKHITTYFPSSNLDGDFRKNVIE